MLSYYELLGAKERYRYVHMRVHTESHLGEKGK